MSEALDPFVMRSSCPTPACVCRVLRAQPTDHLASADTAQVLSDSLLRGSIMRANEGNALSYTPPAACAAPHWRSVERVGILGEKQRSSPSQLMANLLHSFHLPKERLQLLFLFLRTAQEQHIYLGMRTLDSGQPLTAEDATGIFEAAQAQWPGLRLSPVGETSPAEAALSHFEEQTASAPGGGPTQYVRALTGIPATPPDTATAPAYDEAVEKLLLSHDASGELAYLVVAEPISEAECAAMATRCREAESWATSLATLNVRQSEGASHTSGQQHTVGFSTSESDTSNSPLVSDSHQSTTTNSRSDTTSESESRNSSREVSCQLTNRQAAALSELLRTQERRLDQARQLGLWSVAAYVTSNNKRLCQTAADGLTNVSGAARRDNSEAATLEPLRSTDVTGLLERQPRPKYSTRTVRYDCFGTYRAPGLELRLANGQPPSHLFDPRGCELRSTLTTAELAHYVNLPQQPVPGIAVGAATPNFAQQTAKSEGAVSFAAVCQAGQPTAMRYHLNVDCLTRHLLVCGTTGAGKSNSIQALLSALPADLPVLIIEPAKSEYIEWALRWNKTHEKAAYTILTPDGECDGERHEHFHALRLNPLAPVCREGKRPNVEQHQGDLSMALAAIMPQQEGSIGLMLDRLIAETYKRAGWSGEQPRPLDSLPTLKEMSAAVDAAVQEAGYGKSESSETFHGVLKQRLFQLTNGVVGRLLNTKERPDWGQLFDHGRVIVNLDGLRPDEKIFTSELLLLYLQQWRKSAPPLERNSKGRLRHLTVVEEAHNIMSGDAQPGTPRAAASEFFGNMLREVRAYGEGLVIADQQPSKLLDEVLSNTGSKLVHGLQDSRDAEAVGRAMSLDEAGRSHIHRLPVGHALVRQAGQEAEEAVEIKVDRVLDD